MSNDESVNTIKIIVLQYKLKIALEALESIKEQTEYFHGKRVKGSIPVRGASDAKNALEKIKELDREYVIDEIK